MRRFALLCPVLLFAQSAFCISKADFVRSLLKEPRIAGFLHSQTRPRIIIRVSEGKAKALFVYTQKTKHLAPTKALPTTLDVFDITITNRSKLDLKGHLSFKSEGMRGVFEFRQKTIRFSKLEVAET